MDTATVTDTDTDTDTDATTPEPVAAESAPAARSAGPLLAVCGLCGGAGASTLAYLIARHAARSSDEAVLVCDTGGPTGGLAAYAQVASPRSLPRTADAIAAHEPLSEGLFADGAPGVRVIASSPEASSAADPEGLARLLSDATAAHRLTVVDCGTPQGEVERLVLSQASHIAWVMPATHSGIRRGTGVLELFGAEASRRELVVARHDASGRKPPADALTAVAAGRGAPLVLMPHVPDLGEQEPDKALEAAALTLDSIETVISR